MGALDDFDFPSYFLGLCSTFSTLEIQEGDDDERPKQLKMAEKQTITWLSLCSSILQSTVSLASYQ
jgi:hypothetical protein